MIDELPEETAAAGCADETEVVPPLTQGAPELAWSRDEDDDTGGPPARRGVGITRRHRRRRREQRCPNQLPAELLIRRLDTGFKSGHAAGRTTRQSA